MGVDERDDDVVEGVLRLVAELEGHLPPTLLQVVREAGAVDRFRGRLGTLRRVVVDAGETAGPQDPTRVLVLDVVDGGFACAEARAVAGVVVARRRLTLTEWLARVDAFLLARAEESAAAEAAIHRARVTLGTAAPSESLLVHPATVVDDLADLPAHLAGKVPADVVATVRRIGAGLLDARARAVPGGDDARLAEKVACDYLPTTLRIYLELPPEWASAHRGPGGRTALDLLRDQLAVLEGGVADLHHGILTGDHERLLANGAFLADRFAGPSVLDLPAGDLPPHTD